MLRAWWRDERPGWTEGSWWDLTLRDEVRRLLWLPAGPLLAAALQLLGQQAAAAGPGCPHPHPDGWSPGGATVGHAPGWPCACQVVIAAGWEACAAWAAAGSARALVDAAGAEPVVVRSPAVFGQITDPAREELGPALRCSSGSMGNRIAAARQLVAHRQLWGLVDTGTMSGWTARQVVLEVADLDDADAARVVARVCGKVLDRLAAGRPAWTSAEVARAARAARLRLCPDSDRAARSRAWAARAVKIYPNAHGMATLIADLAQVDATRIHRRLSAIGNALATDLGPGDPRNQDQRRADILVDLLLGATGSAAAGTDGVGSADPAPGAGADADGTARPGASDATGAGLDATASGPPRGVGDAVGRSALSGPDVQVIIPLASLLGLSQDPAMVPGLGPIPADLARALAADGRWHAWITDSAGQITATGSAGYTPSAAVARAVRAREPHCRMPGCRRAADRCDLDHTIPYPHGTTTVQNLGPLCRRHHNLKTHLGWRLEPHPEPSEGSSGSRACAIAWQWTTPAGFTHTDHPDTPLE